MHAPNLDINARLKALYEDCSMTVEQISADESLDIGFVKMALKQCSAKYRLGLTSGEEADISKEEYNMALGAYKQLGFTSENESVKERVLWNIINEYKGRNEVKQVTNVFSNVNVLQLEQALVASKKAQDRVKKVKTNSAATKIIEAEVVSTPS